MSMLTRTGTTVLKSRRRYSRNRCPRRQSAPTVLQRVPYANRLSPGHSPTGLSQIPEFARIRSDLWRARSDPIQSRCDSLKANADYLRATSDMLRLKSDALRSKSEQLRSSPGKEADSAEEQKQTMLLKSEEMRSKAEQLQRESDALRAKLNRIRRESETPQFVFPEPGGSPKGVCPVGGGGEGSPSVASSGGGGGTGGALTSGVSSAGVVYLRSASPSSVNQLCPPSPIPEMSPMLCDSWSIVGSVSILLFWCRYTMLVSLVKGVM
ncbi:hypothetical protein ElyMa_001355400 [Elysia marginata]|uniref:Uncharacterized protein n=1 Tax=Elysia marginata TaxID=1093978 RepID=A0AAV4IST5_9GAST|nr:hypothetical protein ElyMa_001355400 [Elysia marginata]